MTTPKKRPGRWKPGQSGNPRGKPKGAKDRRTKWRDQLGAELDDVLAALLIAAKEGDVPAIALVLSRCCPPLRPMRELIDLPGLKADSTPTQLATALIAAAMRGELPSDVASELVQALAAVGRLREVDELAARIAALEKETCHEKP